MAKEWDFLKCSSLKSTNGWRVYPTVLHEFHQQIFGGRPGPKISRKVAEVKVMSPQCAWFLGAEVMTFLWASYGICSYI